MTRSLPENPSISLLKKQAKKLLRHVRDSDSKALASVNAYHPSPDSFSSLRDAQLVTARSYGFVGWSELSDAVELAQDAAINLADKAALFIQLGCVQYSGNDLLRNYQRARNLLNAFPAIAEFNFYTALVANNASAVANYLEAAPELALNSGGPLGFPPLLYVTYSRIGEPEGIRQSLSIAKQLIDYGASPDSHVILNDTYRFTALTGAMGEGEQAVNQPPHQYSDDMVSLLLDANANPNEGQGLYNTMFTESVDKWLAVLLSKGLKATDLLNWDSTSDDKPVFTLDYQLASAVSGNSVARVAMLLSAGANANASNTYNGKAIHTNARLAGYTEIVDLLADNGAIAEDLNVQDQFTLACVNEDNEAISTLLESQPTLTEDATLLHAAAEHASEKIVHRLIANGFDINGQSEHGRTLLHNLALNNKAVEIKRLIKLGARTDIYDTSHNSTAAGFAAYSGCYDAMRVLLDSSNSLLDVLCCAYLSRAKTLIEINPASIHQTTERGNTVLHIIGLWLQDEPDYETYQSIVECLVSAGADINAKNKQDQTPEQFMQSHGFETLAEILADYS